MPIEPPFTLRPYRPGDRDEMADICLRTGDSGADATGLFDDDTLLGDIYALPYVDYASDLAFVVDNGERACGYVLGVADTRAFVDWYRERWLPGYLQRHPLVEPPRTKTEEMAARGAHPEIMLNPDLDEFPAHLHIDLLPELQGKGMGRALIHALLSALRERAVPGVHLGVSPTNASARAFYAHLGFRPLPSDDGSGSLLGLRTDASV